MARLMSDTFYDAEYDKEIPIEEKFNQDVDKEAVLKKYRRDLWGKFVPTFYQYEWYEHFTQRDENGRLAKHLEGTAVVPRRHGKTTGVFKTVLLPWMLEEKGLYVHAFPTLSQAKKAIWNGQGRITRDPDEQAIPYLELIPKELWDTKNNQDLTLTLLNGSVYQLVGVRGHDGTADHLRGINAIGVIADEYGEWKEGVMASIFRPMMAQSGGFIFKIGTPKGENEFYKSYLVAKTEQVTTNRNRAWHYTCEDLYYNDGLPVVTKEFIDRELALGVDPEIIKQEYYCDFHASASGAYYRHQIQKAMDEGRMTKVAYDPNYPVYRFWDLGVAGKSATATNACWDAQFPNEREVRLVGFHQDPDKALWEMMIDLRRSRDYVVSSNFFPWDANSPESTGLTKVEYCREMGVIDDIKVIKRTASKQEGIDLTKAQFHKFWFDENECSYGVQCLKGYVKKKNQTTDAYGDAEKNEFIHGADALRTLGTALAHNEVPIGKANSFQFSKSDESEFATFNDLQI